LSQALQPSTTYYWKIVSRTFATDVDPTLTASTSTATFTTGAGSGGGGASGPYGGTPVSLPGTVQAENFDTGGASVAYSDTSSGNEGGQYRSTDVDVESTSDTGGGFDVGWVAPGEWLKYTVNVTAAGTYTIEARVASSGAGGTFHIESNGVDKTGPITIPDTGGWQTWTTVTKANVSLAAGAQVWRVVFDTTGPGGAIGNLNYLKLTTGGGRHTVARRFQCRGSFRQRISMRAAAVSPIRIRRWRIRAVSTAAPVSMSKLPLTSAVGTTWDGWRRASG
jgi:hypothetical protein